MSVVAVAEGVQLSPRKAGLVASLIRGHTVSDALVILDHTPKKGARLLKKLLLSAQANATNNHGLKEDGLVIASLSVGPNIALKRYRPAAFGRANPYKRRRSQIRVELEGQPAQKPTKKAETSAKTKEST
jgi:large subunit ribosomal protein L22